MANRVNDLKFKKQRLEDPITFGWRLATVKQMNDNLGSVIGKIQHDGRSKIFLSNGSWDRGAKNATPGDEMYGLLIRMKAPKFRIFDRKKQLSDIGVGWRFACLEEARAYSVDVEAVIKEKASGRVCLSDGWFEDRSTFAREEIRDLRYALLIETPVKPDRGESKSGKKARHA